MLHSSFVKTVKEPAFGMEDRINGHVCAGGFVNGVAALVHFHQFADIRCSVPVV